MNKPILNTPTIVVTGTGATALVTIIAWLLHVATKIEMPAAVGAALASLMIVIASWFFPSKPPPEQNAPQTLESKL